jgi:hypothetical protein
VCEIHAVEWDWIGSSMGNALGYGNLITMVWSTHGLLQKERPPRLPYLDHSPKYTGTPYTTGAAPLRYRR